MPQTNRSPSSRLPTSDELLTRLNDQKLGLYRNLARMRQENQAPVQAAGGLRAYADSSEADQPSGFNGYPQARARRVQQSEGGGDSQSSSMSPDTVKKWIDKFRGGQGAAASPEALSPGYSAEPAIMTAPQDTGYLYTFTGAPEAVEATSTGGLYTGIGEAGGAGGAEVGGGAGTGAAGGMGAMGIGAIIAAAIAAQHAMSNNTDKKFEGVKTDDAFSGHLGTEPWLAYLTPNTITPGEKFDASVKKGDWGTAAKRFPAMADYWSDPARGALGEMGEEYLGKGAKWFLNPIGAGLSKVEDWF